MRNFIILAICLLAQATEVRAKISLKEADKILVVITNLHLNKVSMAYRSAVTQPMLEEASYFSERLKLPPPHPIRPADIAGLYVGPPLFSMKEELGQLMKENDSAGPIIAKIHAACFGADGNLLTTNFSFSFERGKLFAVENRIDHEERFSMYDTWAKTPSLIDTNGAYQLATQWLAAVDIDVAALNKKYKHKSEQWWFWNQPGLGVRHPPGDTNKTMLPIYEVTWGSDAALVQILGTTKELMKLRLGDTSFSRRPLLVITNAIQLNNIPDPPMRDLRSPAVSTNSPSPPAQSK